MSLKDKRIETRDKILEVAFICFLKNGFEGVSLNHIIKETGLAKGGFYHHFESKDILLQEIMKKYFVNFFAESVYDISMYEGETSKLLHLVVEKVSSIESRIHDVCPTDTDANSYLILLQNAILLNDELNALYTDTQLKAERVLTEAIRKGQESGSLSQRIAPEEGAELINNTIWGALFQSNIISGKSLQDSLNKSIDSLMRLLAL